MKHLGVAIVFSVLMSGAANLAAAEVWTVLEHPSLVNLDPGPDRLWNTADDNAGGAGIPLGGGLGANPNGANAVWFSGVPNYYSGTYETDGIGVGSFMFTANNPVLETLGVGPTAGAPLDTSVPNSLTVNPDQTFTAQRFWTFDGLPPDPDFQSQTTGWILAPGDDPLAVTGDADIAASINFLLPLVPANADFVVFFEGSFLDLGGAPFAGDFTGLAYHTPIPIPTMAPLVALLGGALLRRRRRPIG